jgi:hypothetical protein
MGAGNILPIKGVRAEIDGEEHILRFTMGSLAWLADKHGSINNVLSVFNSMQTGEMSADNLHTLADFVCAALKYENKNITPEEVENTLDISDILNLLPALIDAFTIAMGNSTKGDANPQEV